MKLITSPEREPITLDEARAQCRVDGEYDDTYIESLIGVACNYAQTVTRRALVSQTWEMALKCWPCVRELPLPKPPLQSVKRFE